MTTEMLEKPIELPIKTIHESCFWEEDDPRWQWMDVEETTSTYNSINYDISLDVDSFIFAFTGRRGGGKTTSMTDEAVKAMVIYPKMRLLSNYPIECRVNLTDGSTKTVKAETLDLYKLLCFDADYKNCLICIDEAPDIISHMASMTWKNRLLNIFVRQLRKNRNSLMLGAQEFGLIDKSMRWQVDVIVECEDASRKYGGPANQRGELILQRWLDNSGMWTGQTWKEQQEYNRVRGNFEDVAEERELYPRFLWADQEDGGHRAIFDTYYQQDVWESLRKVDMQLDSYHVGDKKNAEDVQDQETGTTPFLLAVQSLRQLIRTGAVEIEQPQFWKSIGKISKAAKDSLSKKLATAGLDGSLPHKGGHKWYSLKGFDMDAFLRGGEE